MELASLSLAKDCWYYEMTGNDDYGWPLELNGSIIYEQTKNNPK